MLSDKCQTASQGLTSPSSLLGKLTQRLRHSVQSLWKLALPAPSLGISSRSPDPSPPRVHSEPADTQPVLPMTHRDLPLRHTVQKRSRMTREVLGQPKRIKPRDSEPQLLSAATFKPQVTQKKLIKVALKSREEQLRELLQLVQPSAQSLEWFSPSKSVCSFPVRDKASPKLPRRSSTPVYIPPRHLASPKNRSEPGSPQTPEFRAAPAVFEADLLSVSQALPTQVFSFTQENDSSSFIH